MKYFVYIQVLILWELNCISASVSTQVHSVTSFPFFFNTSPSAIALLGFFDILPVTPDSGMLPELYILAFLFSGMAIYKHRENIKRLLSGTESRI